MINIVIYLLTCTCVSLQKCSLQVLPAKTGYPELGRVLLAYFVFVVHCCQLSTDPQGEILSVIWVVGNLCWAYLIAVRLLNDPRLGLCDAHRVKGCEI